MRQMAFSTTMRAFLEDPHVARLAVLDGEGFPHVVPIWYAADVDDIVFFSSRDARKVAHIRENGKGAVTIGGEPYGAEGYLLKGDFSLEEDVDHHWLSEIVHRYEPKDLADRHVTEWGAGDLVLIRFKPHKMIRIT